MRVRRALFGVALITVMGVVTGACHFNNWYEFRGYNDLRASNQDPHNLNTTSVQGLHQAYQVPIGSVSGYYAALQSGPIEVDGDVFVNGNDGYLHAYKEANGQNLWNGPTSGTASIGSPPPTGAYSVNPAVFRFIVAPSAANNVVYAYRLNGTPLWATALGPWGGSIDVNSAAVDDTGSGQVFITAGRAVFSLNEDTGAVLWTYTLGSAASAPVMMPSGNYVYVGTSGGHVKALHSIGGGLAWDWAAASSLPIAGLAFDDSSLVIVSISGGDLKALTATGPNVVWTAKGFGGSAVTAENAPAYANGVVYEVTADGRVKAFSDGNGRQIWETSGTPTPTSISIANGVLYAAPTLKAFNASGLGLLANPGFTGSYADSEAVPADGLVWVVGSDGYLHAFV